MYRGLASLSANTDDVRAQAPRLPRTQINVSYQHRQSKVQGRGTSEPLFQYYLEPRGDNL
ncbi:hypothetical protein K439DRAFT_1633473 [Ramaria rubella]|nr:hypothetical protein K439DRAFT_1633473 [Ramaria rubella]